MTNNYFKIYLEQIFALAETLVIKSTASANGINRRMIELYGEESVDLGNPATWKYYLNISGEYHPIDERMTVVSMDTLETIEFNKENLKIHRATNREYQYGTRKYLELVNRYPKQEQLILGILYPCDIEESIKAPEGKILSYNKKLVEFNEYSFIDRLQDWINIYLEQNTNPQYSVSDELFPSVMVGKMYIDMIPAIMNIRLRACRTNEAHSYHVKRYLASHGFLDDYMDHLTTKQALWCYRNINYIEKYSGHRDTFEWLIENILTERRIPIGEYNMIHDTSKQPNSVNDFDPTTFKDVIYPELMFEKTNLNPIAPSNEGVNLTLEGVFSKEDKLTTENERFHTTDLPVAKEKMENSLSNFLKTKVLESAMYDYTDSQSVKLSDVLINQWIERAFNGTYRAIILANNPVTGENIPLTSKEALYLLYYATMRGHGWNDVLYIPDFYACRVPRTPLPDVNDIRKHVPWKRISKEAAQLALDLMPEIGVAYSTDQFYNDCVALFDAANKQNNLISVYEELMDRGYAENMINRIYGIKHYPREREVTFEAWLDEKNIYVEDFKQDDFQALSKSLLAIGTGTLLNTTTSTRALQRAMLSLFMKLSSYSIQLLTDINKSSLQQTGGNRVRVGDRLGAFETRLEVDTLEVEVIDLNARVTQHVDYDTNKIDYTDDQDARIHMDVDFEIADIFENSNGIHYTWHTRVPISRITVTHGYGTYPNKLHIAPTWLSDESLDYDQLKSYDLVDVYQRDLGCSTRPDDEPVPLEYYWINRYHNGFKEVTPVLRSLFQTDHQNGFANLGQWMVGIWEDPNHTGYAEVNGRIGDNFFNDHHNGFKEIDPPIESVFESKYQEGFRDVETVDISKGFSINAIEGIKESIIDIDISDKTDELNGFEGVTE